MWNKRLPAIIALTALAGLPALHAAHADTPATRAADQTLTLITGDKVTLRGGALSVTPGPGRKVGFLRQGTGDDLTLIPADVAALVANGTLDQRLFQVHKLFEDGFDDEKSPTLPLIVQNRPGVRAALSGRALTSVNATAIALDKKQPMLARLLGTGVRAASQVQRIWLDGKVSANLDRSVAQIGAPEAWQAGFTGQGVKVAVLDTGADPAHPDLSGQIAASQDFTDSGGTADGHGHGTHVASTIAGLGKAGTPVRKGVAPGAQLLVGKVLSDRGSGSESGIIAGMEWAARGGAKIVNMSLGSPDTPDVDPLEAAIERLTQETGTLFVVAAGNDGPGDRTLGSPGSADAALTVGAVDRQDKLAPFSSRGPRMTDSAIKPDLVAPGVGIVAARSSTSALPAVDGQYTGMSGTSMAAPHVAGAVAVLAQQHPDWTGKQLKAALIGSVKTVDGTAFQRGAGRVDVARAVRQQISADTGAITFGRIAHPHDQGKITKTVTYRNGGTQPVTLELSAELATADGKTAPSGMFTVPATVTVPAGGTATADLIADPTLGDPGSYGGRLVAKATDVSVVATVSLDKEPPSHTARIKLLDQEGGTPDPAEVGFPVYFYPVSGGLPVQFPVAGGAAEVRLPAGRYMALAVIGTSPAGGDYTQSLAVLPDVDVSADREIVFDARTAKPRDVATDQPGTETIKEEFLMVRDRPGGQQPIAVAAIGEDGMRFHITPTEGKVDGFRSRLWTVLSKRGAEGSFADSPYAYHLVLPAEGRIPAEHKVRDRDLGTVKADYAALRQRLIVPMDVMPQLPESWGPEAGRIELPTLLPVARTEYFTPGIPWQRVLNTFLTVEYGKPQTFTPHRRVQERWNTAVIGPALPEWSSITRTGDKLAVEVPIGHTPNRTRTGFHLFREGTTTLLLDGKEIGRQERLPYQTAPLTFTAPASKGRYQLVLEGVSDEYAAELSNKVRAEWTFSSAKDGKAALIALLAEPKLDLDNAAPAGPMLVPLRLDRSEQTGAARVRQVKAEVSYDDGATWRHVLVVPTGQDTWHATLLNPRKPGGFVSLRLSAQDSDGNGAVQTMTRAFRLR